MADGSASPAAVDDSGNGVGRGGARASKTKARATAEKASGKKRKAGSEKKKGGGGGGDESGSEDEGSKPRTKSLTSLTLSELKQLAIDKRVAVTADNPKKAHYIAALTAAGVTGEPLAPRTKGKSKAKSPAAGKPSAAKKAKKAAAASDEEDDDEEEDGDDADDEEEKPKKKAAKSKSPAKGKAKKAKAKAKEDDDDGDADMSGGDDDESDGDSKKKKGKGKAKPAKKAAADKPKKAAAAAAGDANDQKVAAFKDELSGASIDDLKQELERNRQIKSGKKGELIDRVADGRVFGALPRCSRCGVATLKVKYATKTGHGGQGAFQCPGYYEDHFHHCGYRSTSEVRTPWVAADS